MARERWNILLGIGATILVVAAVGHEFLVNDETSAQDGPTRACTLIGCASAASVEIGALPRTARLIELCANETCEVQSVYRTRKYMNDEILVYLPLPEGSKQKRVEMRLTVVDREGRDIAEDTLVGETEPWYPNGEACGGPCQEIKAIFKNGKLTRTYRPR